MSFDLRTRIIRYAIRLALRNPLPERIPLSDREKVAARKYSGAYLTDKDGKRKFFAENVTTAGLDGRWFETPFADGVDRSIANSELENFGVQFSQYYADLEITYTAAWEFIAYQWLGVPGLLLWKERLIQRFYNSRELATEARMAVLTRFLERTQEDHEYRTGIDRYLTHLYGPRWKAHNDNLKLYSFHELLFDSLVETGELSHGEQGYRMTPKAVVTLEQYEETSKRYQETARLQIILIAVTAVLAIVGLAQVYSTLVAAEKPLSALWQP